MVTNRAIKLCMKLTLYTILLLTFYTMYMRNAIDQFLRRSTTIGYRQEKVEKYSAPILIICPTPAFKPSFSKKMIWINSALIHYFGLMKNTDKNLKIIHRWCLSTKIWHISLIRTGKLQFLILGKKVSKTIESK